MSINNRNVKQLRDQVVESKKELAEDLKVCGSKYLTKKACSCGCGGCFKFRKFKI